MFEEIFFRGLLLSWLHAHMPAKSAIVVAALLFAAMHLYPSALPYTFLRFCFDCCIVRARMQTCTRAHIKQP
ncbi:MAG: CPBP family intramembrane metalloprotease [Acidobacteria bacterium]|nr:CPBP family intramembrane metalloprotease [Acidobacteriota bacterium]MBV9482741.1 CPBP family intramembrane metalloprotease [Acidobacteriota bacterium]